MPDRYQLIQQCIDRAVTAERARSQFHRSLNRTLANLHHSIHLPQQDAPSHITCFVIRYIQVIPAWLLQLDQLCEAGGLNFRPVRELILKNFREMPARPAQAQGLDTILGEAYLAHRTMEDINDVLHPACGTPLLPMDTMVANLVVRELLGETLACQLDDLSALLMRHFEPQELNAAKQVSMILCKQRYDDTPGEWPDFANQLQIELRTPALTRQFDLSH